MLEKAGAYKIDAADDPVCATRDAAIEIEVDAELREVLPRLRPEEVAVLALLRKRLNSQNGSLGRIVRQAAP